MTPTLVSVVINNYNYADYLADAVESALAQTHPRTEVVVVDDGSTDGSRELLARWDGRIRVVLKENGGQASALNEGFVASRGDLVLFVDADDALDPDAVATLLAAWRPGVAKVHAPVQLMDADGRPTGGRLPADAMPRGDLRSLVLATGGYASTGTTGTAFSRGCLERLMPVSDPEWFHQPDVYLWLLAPFVGEVAAVDRTVARVRVHGANNWSMTRLDAGRLADHIALAVRKEKLLREHAADLGTEPPVDWLLRDPMHLQSRISLLRLAPDQHPFPDDRRHRLGRYGIAAAFRHPSFSWRKKLFMAAWFVLAALLPARPALRVIRAGMLRGDRPPWFQRFIERGASP